jgi:hypothetical protein
LEIATGRWLAATAQSPYLLVEADSREAVLSLASRAIVFYERIHKKHDGNIPVSQKLFTNSIKVKELVAA